MNKKDITILVVDDELEMRSLISEYLRDIEGYTVIEADCGPGALELLENKHADLVLSDINMPGMKGFELLNIIRESYPAMKRVLITSYNVEEYLELASKYDVGNILAKTTPFNFDELASILDALISNDIFGIERFFNETAQSISFSITTSKNLEQHAITLMSFIGDTSFTKKLELVLVELLTNAIFYGIRHESPETKEKWNHDFTLTEKDAVLICAAKDQTKFAVSVTDCGGKLKKNDVLYWLHRQIAQDADGLPLGLYDSHGRGFFITRKYIDRCIINIDEGHRTEIIIINYYNNEYIGYKPLYINEL